MLRSNPSSSGSREYRAFFMSGWLMAFIYLVVLALLGVWLLARGPAMLTDPGLSLLFPGLVLGLLFFGLSGFVILEPNIAAVLTFFGSYAGSFSRPGFSWYNPLCKRMKISLRVYNLSTPILKVNDKSGNPIEVGAVITWRVRDTARAVFDVEDFARFVAIQSESALRQVVSSRYYDGDKDGKESLRGDLDTVTRMLSEAIQEHIDLAGLEIVEAKISHLAYAPEIASAMLRRQQAQAVVAARTQIVTGAVSMAHMVLQRLEAGGAVQMTDRDKVQLVTNLMTVLVSENETQPVLSMSRPDNTAG